MFYFFRIMKREMVIAEGEKEQKGHRKRKPYSQYHKQDRNYRNREKD